MNLNEFKQYYQEFEQKCEEIIGFKSNEYSTDEDKLWNFKVIAEITGLKPSQVALCHWFKHVVTIAKHVMQETGELEWETESGEGLKQRFSDSHNYHSLTLGCLEEERKQPKTANNNNIHRDFKAVYGDIVTKIQAIKNVGLEPCSIIVDRFTYQTLKSELKLKRISFDYDGEIPVVIDPAAVEYTVRVLPYPDQLLAYAGTIGEGE